MSNDIEEFVRFCIHCILTRSGENVPRPLGSALHGSKPNQVVHMDFLYVGDGFDGMKYMLVIRGDISSFVWLHLAAAAKAEVTAQAMYKWIASFSIMDWVLSDQGSHFMNELNEELFRKYKV